MALRLDSFNLTELAARPEDAFRLASLAMAEGQRIPGYGGDCYRFRMGDAAAVIRTRLDPERMRRCRHSWMACGGCTA